MITGNYCVVSCREAESQYVRRLPRARTHHGAEDESKEMRAAAEQVAKSVEAAEAGRREREERLVEFLEGLRAEEARRRVAIDAQDRRRHEAVGQRHPEDNRCHEESESIDQRRPEKCVTEPESG